MNMLVCTFWHTCLSVPLDKKEFLETGLQNQRLDILSLINTHFVMNILHVFVKCIHKYCCIYLQTQCTGLHSQQ